jgi:hypothetical protein
VDADPRLNRRPGWCGDLRFGQDAGMELATSVVNNQGVLWGFCLIIVVVIFIRLVGRH